MRAILLAVFCCISGFTHSQSPVGLWEATKVTVGEEIMTPVGKWTRINANGTYQSGNGWQQNSEGSWSFDPSSAMYAAVETDGLDDPFGGFKVAFDGGNMLWHRNEEGHAVVVTWKPVSSIPRTPADLLVGVWERKSDMSESRINDVASTRQHIFIRWDRIYVEWDKGVEKRYGYWFINAHRPELTLISMGGDTAPESWRVIVEPTTLTLTGISDSNKGNILSFRRVRSLPD